MYQPSLDQETHAVRQLKLTDIYRCLPAFSHLFDFTFENKRANSFTDKERIALCLAENLSREDGAHRVSRDIHQQLVNFGFGKAVQSHIFADASARQCPHQSAQGMGIMYRIRTIKHEIQWYSMAISCFSCAVSGG